MLYCIWQDPWMSVSRDTYIANMLAEIGWRVPDLGEVRYPQFAWTPALLASIDGVLLSSEPYRFTDAHCDALERQIGKPVLLVDGEMMSWYGSRSLQGLRYLRQLAQRRRRAALGGGPSGPYQSAASVAPSGTAARSLLSCRRPRALSMARLSLSAEPPMAWCSVAAWSLTAIGW
jgi:hypothetical protein